MSRCDFLLMLCEFKNEATRRTFERPSNLTISMMCFISIFMTLDVHGSVQRKTLCFKFTIMCDKRTESYMKSLPTLCMIFGCKYSQEDYNFSNGVEEHWKIDKSSIFDSNRIHCFASWRDKETDPHFVIPNFAYKFRMRDAFHSLTFYA